jgi:hypothetical protein
MRYVSYKSCRETLNTHFIFSDFFYNCVVYEIMWKTFVVRGKPQTTIWLMRIACWTPKATNTHRICNTHCFSTAKMFERTRLNCTSYVHCLSCSEMFKSHKKNMFHGYVTNFLHVQYQYIIYRRIFITDYLRQNACNLFLNWWHTSLRL